ncbi:MAG TPA: hypothetical protein VGZ04_08135 [Acidimicrobiales bacterium]|jgi:hypothetical protein|nr:hypothetical protein [Acidimicrobiales bacterium]
MKRFVRRQTTEDHRLKLLARADELKASLLHTSVQAAALDGDAVSVSEPILAAPRLTLDQMWGLE